MHLKRIRVTQPQSFAAFTQWFELQAARNPELTALVFEDRSMTYGELNARANQLAHRLRKLGVGPDVIVGLLMERSLELMIAILGVLKAGGAYLPLDPDYPHERLRFMIDDARDADVLTQTHLLDAVPERLSRNRRFRSTTIARLSDESVENPPANVSEQNLAYCIYTSGSTGQPKGTLNTHTGISNRLCWMQDTYQLTDRRSRPAKDNLQLRCFGLGVFLAVDDRRLARAGATRRAERLVHTWCVLFASRESRRCTSLPRCCAPFSRNRSVERCTSLKRMICSGEALTFDLQQLFFEKLPSVELHNLYGPTEAAVDVTWWQCEKDSTSPVVPIGKAIANIGIYILDPHFNPVPDGVEGELYIGGIQLARGYLNRADLTAEKFIPDARGPCGARLYRTGDLARYRADGNVEYLGRIDHQIKLRGIRIELGEIEAALNTHPQIQETVVIARENGIDDHRLIAYVVTEQNGAHDMTAEFRRYLREKLPEQMVPTAYVALESLPHLPNGKVDRKSLPAVDFSEQRVEYVAPRTKIEKQR